MKVRPQASLPVDTETSGVVVLGFGPQPVEFISKAAKLCGKGAVVDPRVAKMAGAVIAAGAPKALAALAARLEAGAIQAATERHKNLPPGAAEWLGAGERGVSSNAIFSHLTGIDASGSSGFDTPYDPADFRRCRLLIEQVPSLLGRLSEMRSVSPAWASLVDQWDEICRVMDEESPDWRAGRGKAPRTHQLIKTAIGRD